MDSSLPRAVALVGRPNVGKSRLFNRLARRRIAIVHDQAGVTRDVNSFEVDNDYTLFDTGGIGLIVDMDHQKLIEAAEDQVWFAVAAATIILFVVDLREGLTSLDEIVAAKLRSSGKRIILVVNKADNENLAQRATEFASLGFKEIVAVSAEHGYNETGLRNAIENALPTRMDVDSPEAIEMQRIGIAFIGKPNVGKSSIVNRLLANDRLVVSEIPGTTRDSVSLNLDYAAPDGETWHFRLADTAGLRKHRQISHSIEYFSTVRSRRAIEFSDIVFLVIEAESGITRTDKALAGEILDAGKCLGVIVNKWDVAVEQFSREPVKGFDTVDEFRDSFTEAIRKELFFLPESPVFFVSAKTGLSFDRIMKVARRLWETSGRKLPTPKINDLIEKVTTKRTPRFLGNKRFRVYYSTQVGNRPFTFRLFCNRATKLEDGYKRYLERNFTKEFGLEGCPIVFDLRGKTVRYADNK